MDDESKVVVFGEEGYLLVESTSKKLLLPSCKLRDREEFEQAASRCLNEVCIMIITICRAY